MRRHPIRRRLTGWYAGTLLAILLAGGLVIERLVHATLERDVERSLASSAHFVDELFRWERREYPSTEVTIAHIADEIVFPDRVVEFIRPDGTLLRGAARPAFEGPARLAPPVRILERPFATGLAPGWRMRIHLSAAGTARALARLDLWFAVAIPAAVLVAGLGGWWLTGRTLRPVGLMAAAAERIDAADPAQRLPVVDPKDELGRLGARFNALLDRLAGALVQQRRFLADAAHELRTPLARLRSHLELALHTPADAPGHGEALALAQADLGHTTAVLDELLQLARADAGERPHALAPGWLDDVVAASAGAWRGAAAQGGVALELERLEEAPARFEPELVRRLLDVLVENAIRYTPAGGRVAVRVFPDDERRAVLEVEDTGIGIPAAERPHLFERFHRGRAARALVPEGSGLGLAIAEWIVREHGGALALLPGTRPGPMPGTLARVVLPALPATAATAAADVHRQFIEAG
ncbi:MAG TPA: HAMP domain-containing sensor histidine kinase [Gemmatimonadales bacterium]|nr:HAMP domain-containing sensor histidine kinase [Gemmatimonadales bacterium]